MFTAFCKSDLYSDETPQAIELAAHVERQLTAHRQRLTEKVVDGNVGEVDWDVGESSTPIAVTHDFGRWVGYLDRVEVEDGPGVFYAQVQRRGKPVWGRFVGKAPAQETAKFTVLLRPVCDEGPVGWRVVGAYAGEAAPPFPGDPFERANSRPYWRRHALLDGVLPYNHGTVTKTCPWEDAEEKAA